ncbi:MAG: CDGSH iron-sulfur domain-containing protein [Chloroflexi bacterium]|nr:CDGSH iron-sulfur domain-containing protein [Chloroflexota bacterium]MDA1147490.1 CDGSH iron-sulfur domain-containing protein [Chloroflexota bacterium]
MATIKVNNNGPYIVSGELELVDATGKAFTKTGTLALCRCGHSANKPFCDGSHNREGFESEVQAS